MDNTIKFNFLKFSEGNLENEKGKKNLLASEDLEGKTEEDSKFTLEGDETVGEISIGDEIGDETVEKTSIGNEDNINLVIEEINNDINNVKLDKKHINKKSDNENRYIPNIPATIFILIFIAAKNRIFLIKPNIAAIIIIYLTTYTCGV